MDNHEYRKRDAYFDTPRLEGIIKARLKRLSRLKQKYLKIKSLPENEMDENRISLLNELKNKMQLEKIRGEIEEANLDPELRVILKEI